MRRSVQATVVLESSPTSVTYKLQALHWGDDVLKGRKVEEVRNNLPHKYL